MVSRILLASTGAFLAASTTLASPARAQQSAADLQPVASVEGITEYKLDNGLEVLLFPDPSKPQITVNITYMVGSRFEGYGETGMAHLLEHLMFRGSTGHTDIDKELAERGASYNGTTWYDRTNYFETFAANADNLEWALDLEADRMENSFISQDELDSEMTVVRNEMESGENDASGILEDRTLATAYLWHNYGKSTIGARSDVENVPIERLQAFYHKYYQPDNAVLVVAGNFDRDETLELIAEKFGGIPRPERTGADTLYPTYTVEPTQDGERTVTLRRVGDVQYVNTMYHVPPGSHPEYPAISVLSFALGDNPSGRLYKALVETGLATRASSSALQLREAGPLMMEATVDPDKDLTQVLDSLNATVEGVLTQPVTSEEVERAKAALLNGITQSFNSSQRIALQLSEWASMGDWRLFFINRDRIEAVTAEDVNRVAHEYLKPDNRTVGLFYPTAHPDRAEIPAVPDIDAMVDGYKGREAIAEGEAFDPSPSNIEARTVRYTLPNGMEIALLSKQTRGDAAIVRIRLALGDEQSQMGRATAASLAGAMLMRGTTEHTRQQIQDELDRLKATGGVSGGAIIATGQFQTVRQSVPDVIRLLSEIVREPAFPQSEFDLLKQQSLASIDESRSEPNALAQLELARHMSNWPKGHPSYVETFDESAASIEATTLDDVRAYYRDFWGPQDGNIVVVGDFDEDEVRQVIRDSFGDWESPHPFQRIATPFYDPTPEDTAIETPDKANAIFLAQQNLALRDTDPDYPALLMASQILGGGALNSRLARRIRTDEGISYSVGASISGHPVDRAGQFFAYAIYAPQNVDRLEAAFKEEVQRAIDDGFTQDELQTAKQGWLDARRLSRAQDGRLAGTLSQDLYFDRTIMFDGEMEDRVRAVTLDQVNRAIRKWLDPSKMTIVKAGDFAKP